MHCSIHFYHILQTKKTVLKYKDNQVFIRNVGLWGLINYISLYYYSNYINTNFHSIKVNTMGLLLIFFYYNICTTVLQVKNITLH